ncbi:MAG: ATP-binding cassette domain-containing protein [Clostridiales bacterium]|nr:ATP-binding cassette domain-containing protein [Clostridiales bacterium]
MEKSTDIIFRDVRFCYGEVCAVQGVNFSLRGKELTVLVGPNGGGKSTLIKLMTGLIKPDEGRIEFRKGLEVGYVPQNFAFDTAFPLTVEDLVLQGTLQKAIRPFGRYSYAQKAKARSAIIHAGLSGCENRGIGQLSGGQLKRAVIARVFASDANLIALDEPDAGLDVEAAGELLTILNEMKQHKTIVIASHNISQLFGIAEKALYVNKTVRKYDSPAELKDELKGGISL